MMNTVYCGNLHFFSPTRKGLTPASEARGVRSNPLFAGAVSTKNNAVRLRGNPPFAGAMERGNIP